MLDLRQLHGATDCDGMLRAHCVARRLRRRRPIKSEAAAATDAVKAYLLDLQDPSAALESERRHASSGAGPGLPAVAVAPHRSRVYADQGNGRRPAFPTRGPPAAVCRHR